MEEVLKKQREYFLSRATLPYSARRDALRKLYRAIKSHEKELQEALKEDLGKESFLTFSHRKSVVKRGTWLDFPLRYQPYKTWKEKFIKKYLR